MDGATPQSGSRLCNALRVTAKSQVVGLQQRQRLGPLLYVDGPVETTACTQRTCRSTQRAELSACGCEICQPRAIRPAWVALLSPSRAKCTADYMHHTRQTFYFSLYLGEGQLRALTLNLNTVAPRETWEVDEFCSVVQPD